MTKLTRIVGLFDQHYPECIAAFWDPANPRKTSPLFKFLSDFQPQVLIHGGDQLDLSCITHFNNGKPKLVEGKRISQDYAGYNVLLDRLESVCHKAEKVVWLTGNHENWVDYLVESNPQAYEGIIEVENHLNLRSRGYKLFKRRELFKIGKLALIHGDYKDKYIPIYHARAIADLYNTNIVYGHFHTHQEYVKTRPAGYSSISAMSVGTLSHTNPAWLRNAPNAWVNSFAVILMQENGDFNFHRVSISAQGSFTFDGVLYR